MKITYYTDGAEIRMKNRRAFVSTQDDLVLLKFWRVDGSTQPRAVHAPIRNCGAYTSIKLDRDTLAAIYMVLAEEGKRQINRSEIPNNSQIKTETK